MRRDYLQEQGLPTPIFYAPLTQGDLTDHISGNAFQGASTTITWDNTEQMYGMKKSGTGCARCSGLNLGLPFTSSSYANVECTMMFKIKFKSSLHTTNSFNFMSLACGSISGSSQHRFPNVSYNAVSSVCSMNVLYNMHYIMSNGVISLYVNNEYVRNLTGDSFNYTECNSYVNFFSGNWSGNDGGALIKDVWIFNQVLTDDQIRQIQSI